MTVSADLSLPFGPLSSGGFLFSIVFLSLSKTKSRYVAVVSPGIQFPQAHQLTFRFADHCNDYAERAGLSSACLKKCFHFFFSFPIPFPASLGIS